jgi:hypothetical protein
MRSHGHDVHEQAVCALPPLVDAAGQSLPDRRARLQGTENGQGCNGGDRQIGTDIVGYRDQTKHLDVEHFAGGSNTREFLAGDDPEPEIQALPPDGLLDGTGMPFKQVADRRPDEVRAGMQELWIAPMAGRA